MSQQDSIYQCPICMRLPAGNVVPCFCPGGKKGHSYALRKKGPQHLIRFFAQIALVIAFSIATTGFSQVALWPKAPIPLQESLKFSGDLPAEALGTFADGTKFLALEMPVPADSYSQFKVRSSPALRSLTLAQNPNTLVAHVDFSPGKVQTDSYLSHFSNQPERIYGLVAFDPKQKPDLEITWLSMRNGVDISPLIPDTSREGLLSPQDKTDAKGLHYDAFALNASRNPLVIWVESPALDTELVVYDSKGKIVTSNRDAGLVAAQFQPRVVVPPSQETYEVRVLSSSDLTGPKVMPGYQLHVKTFEKLNRPELKPLHITFVDATPTTRSRDLPATLATLQTRTQEIWSQCDIPISFAKQVVSLPLMKRQQTFDAGQHAWSSSEQRIFARLKPYHKASQDVVVILVDSIDKGRREAVSYPTTRFSPENSNIIVLAKSVLGQANLSSTLAHELGHILGLDHQDVLGESGDKSIQNPENIMYSAFEIFEEAKSQLLDNLRPGLSTDLPWFKSQSKHDPTRPDPQTQLSQLQCEVAAHTFARPTVQRPPYIFPATRHLQDGKREHILSQASPLVDTSRHLEVFYLPYTDTAPRRVCLTSQDFDPFLFVQNKRGETVAENDDQRGSLDACLTVRVNKQDGFLVIGVTSSETEAFGRFTLTITTQH